MSHSTHIRSLLGWFLHAAQPNQQCQSTEGQWSKSYNHVGRADFRYCSHLPNACFRWEIMRDMGGCGCMTSLCFLHVLLAPTNWGIERYVHSADASRLSDVNQLRQQSLLLDLESGTICRWTSYSQTCDKAVLDSRWRYFYLASATTVRVNLFNCALEIHLLPYLSCLDWVHMVLQLRLMPGWGS